MNDELIKELKDAGFPFKKWPGAGSVVFKNSKTDEEGNLITEGSPLMVPTLSELIDACGDDFYALQKDNDGWIAIGKPEWVVNQHGKTPEIAVARLYIVLSK